MQELADKNAEKLTTAVFLRAYVSAAKTVGNEKSDEFRQTFSKEFSAIWNTIPYNEVKDEVEANKGQLSLFNPNLVTAGIDTQIQPFLDNNKNVVSEDLVVSFIGIRNVLDKRVALVPSMLQVMTDLYERNASKVVKKDIWAEREAVFTDKDTGSPLVVAVWDSGVDMSIFPEYVRHKDTKGNNGIGYSLVEYKNDGLLLENPQGKITSDVNRLQALTKGFMDIQAAINSPEADEVRRTMSSLKTEEAKSFIEELSFYGLYSHGTHVAGIAVKDNPFARLLVVRMGGDYRTLPPPHSKEQAHFQAKMFGDIVKYLKDNKVRVVNMSWRYSPAAYEGLLSLNGIGKTPEERKKMAKEMFDIEKKALYNAFKSAPEILFVCGSGNENNDASFEEYIPASFSDLPNLITIGAVDNEGKKTSFTTEGKTVRSYANGFEVESFVPGGDKIKFSGTSMASPHVVNLAAKMLALKPNFQPKEIISFIERCSDTLPENPKLRLINPKKTLELVRPL
jgi:subtilisin family serine protease